MPLEKKTVSLEFKAGLNQKASEKSLPAGELALLENTRFEKTGQLRKRFPFVREDNTANVPNVVPPTETGGSDTTFTEAKAIATFKDEVIVFDKTTAYGKSVDNEWVSKGSVVDCKLDHNYIERDTGVEHSTPQVHTLNGFRIVVWSELDPAPKATTTTNDYTVYCSVYDATTGASVAVRQSVHTMSGAEDNPYEIPRPQIVPMGDHLFILYVKKTAATPVYKVHYNHIDTGANISAGVAIGTERTLQYTLSTATEDVTLHPGVTTGVGTIQGTPLFLATYTSNDVPGSATDFCAVLWLTVTRLKLGLWKKVGSNLVADFDASAASYQSNVSDSEALLLWFDGPDISLTALNTDTTNGWLHVMYTQDAVEDLGAYSAVSLAGTTLTITTTPDHDLVVGDWVTLIDSTGTDYSGVHYVTNIVNAKAFDIYHTESPAGSNTGTFQGTKPVVRGVLLHKDLRNLSDPVTYQERALLYNATTTDTTGTPTVLATLFTVPSTDGLLAGSSVAHDHAIYTNTITTKTESSGTVTLEYGTTSVLKRFSTVISDIFVDNSAEYFAAAIAYRTASARNYGSSALLICDTSGNVVAKGGTGLTASCFGTDFFEFQAAVFLNIQRKFFYGTSRVQNTEGSKYQFGTTKWIGEHEKSTTGTGFVFDRDTQVFNSALGTIDFDPPRTLPSVEAGGSLLVASGILWQYAGDRFKENGFFIYPQIKGNTEGSGAIAAGTYFYTAIFEHTDDSGSVQRSYPAEQLEVTYSSSGKGSTLEIYTLPYTYRTSANRLRSPRIVLYRTVESGTIFYRVGDLEVDTGATTQSISDTSSDSNITSNEIIYTHGGIIGHIAPPSCTDIVSHKERLFLATTENNIWYSKRVSAGLEIGFSDIQTKTMDSNSQEVTAIESNLEHLCVFTKYDGYFLAGDGPNDAGLGGAFSPVRKFAAGQGAVAGSAHANTPLGVIYKAERGIYLVGRNMATKYIGARVEDTGKYKILSADVLDSVNEVRLVLGADPDDASDKVGLRTILVYNYFFDQWSHTVFADGLNTLNKDAVVSGGNYYVLMNDNSVSPYSGVYKEDTTPATYVDGKILGSTTSNTGYAMKLRTAWLHIGPLQHLQRVYRVMLLGTYVGAHTITIKAYTDYSTASPSTFTKGIASDPNPYQIRVYLTNQRCRALQIEVSDGTLQPESLKIDGLALEVGLRPGTFKLPATQEATL